MTHAFRPDGIPSTTAMPDGPRRSARIAELTKKRNINEVKATEPQPKLGRRTVKETTGLVKPSRLSRGPPRKESAIERSKTRGKRPLVRPKGKLPEIERKALSKNRRGSHRVTGETGPQQARASKRLAANHLVPQPLQPTLTAEAVRSPESEADPQQGIAGAVLSRDALQSLEIKTANDPLPEELSAVGVPSRSLYSCAHFQQFRRTPNACDMPPHTRGTPTNKTVESASRTTAYNKEFADVLEEIGVLEPQFIAGESKLVVPKNYEDILSAIQDRRAHSPEPSSLDYKEYTEAVLHSRSEKAVLMRLFPRFFGIPLEIKKGHRQENDPVWTKGVAITASGSHLESLQKTSPDYTEGLALSAIPGWVRNDVGACAIPSGVTAFPNFLVELKRDMSMYTAHLQNRHRGAIASRAYHEYYEKIQKKPDESWATARVGSIEFNGDTVVGNIHWVDKSSDGQERSYHMTRVLCLFTCGLKFSDFKKARRKARNFRDYFLDVRDNLREECKPLYNATVAPPQPSPEAPAQSQVRTRSTPLSSLEEGDERDSEGSSTERHISDSAEPQGDPTPETSGRVTRQSSKRAQGNAPKDPPGRKSKKRKNGNTERASILNDTGITFEAERLAV